MKFIDLKKQFNLIEEDVNSRIQNVLKHGQYIMGPEIIELESLLSSYVDVKHCITCSSGTDALLMPLMAWDIGPGDAVFTTPFTYIATAEVISLLGATPIFVDIDNETYNISPIELEKSIKKIYQEGELNPKAIIPVDLFGLPADYKNIEKIAKHYKLYILEDSAQGFGGSIYNKKSCSFGNVGTTSFFPAKPLGCYGDGGAIFTNDDYLAKLLKSIRIHGKGKDKYTNIRIGLNGRLDSIQAAILISKMSLFENEIIKRNNIANLYNELLNGYIVTPKIPKGYRSSWAQYSLLANNEKHRNDFIEKLYAKQIPTNIYYSIPLHLQKAFEKLNYKKGDFPISEKISKKIFSLPMYPYLSEKDIKYISKVIIDSK